MWLISCFCLENCRRSAGFCFSRVFCCGGSCLSVDRGTSFFNLCVDEQTGRKFIGLEISSHHSFYIPPIPPGFHNRCFSSSVLYTRQASSHPFHVPDRHHLQNLLQEDRHCQRPANDAVVPAEAGVVDVVTLAGVVVVAAAAAQAAVLQRSVMVGVVAVESSRPANSVLDHVLAQNRRSCCCCCHCGCCGSRSSSYPSRHRHFRRCCWW